MMAPGLNKICGISTDVRSHPCRHLFLVRHPVRYPGIGGFTLLFPVYSTGPDFRRIQKKCPLQAMAGKGHIQLAKAYLCGPLN